MNKCLILGISILILFASCTSKISYLPHYKNYNFNTYGAHIDLNFYTLKSFEGELILVDSTSLTILEDYSHSCMNFAIKDIESYTLRYANPPKYGGFTVANSLITLSHGFWLIITLPINIGSYFLINDRAKKDYQYEDNHLNYNQLRMFARFPQGLPRNVNLSDLKNPEK